MIFCHAGSATLVYEDQGKPFRFEAGDCVLQPPHIRHQVLETSDGFEVVEIGCPADHPTFRDHDLKLPTVDSKPNRDFGGQRFVWYRTALAESHAWLANGFCAADFEFAAATGGLAHVRLVKATGATSLDNYEHSDELAFWFVRRGSSTLIRNNVAHQLSQRDSVVFAPGERHQLVEVSQDFEFLEVRVTNEAT